MNGPAQQDYYMIHDPEHLCNDCIYDGLRDPAGLAKGKTCQFWHDNSFPKFIKECVDYRRGEESIVNSILAKDW